MLLSASQNIMSARNFGYFKISKDLFLKPYVVRKGIREHFNSGGFINFKPIFSLQRKILNLIDRFMRMLVIPKLFEF